tara:strand:- start:6158 stop:6547 length:390 start_codon:yes stop_codon:yes gene_type:complete
MVAKLNKVIKIGLDSNDSLEGGLDQSNTKINTDDIVNGDSAKYEGGADLDFGLTTLAQFPNRFFPGNATFDSDIKKIVGTNDANHFINSVGSAKNFKKLNNQDNNYYTLNVYKSLDSASALIDPLNPNA